MRQIPSTHSRSGLFLMEILLTILFFSITSAICVQFFVKAHLISKNTTELNAAVICCENVADAFKSGDGSADSLIALYPDATIENAAILIFFDGNYTACTETDSTYQIRVHFTNENDNSYADIYFSEHDSSTTIYTLHVEKHLAMTACANLSFGGVL